MRAIWINIPHSGVFLCDPSLSASHLPYVVVQLSNIIYEMQPHTLSCSCAGHPVIKLTAARDSELKKKLAARDYHTHWLQMYQALIMQSSLCCRESLVCVSGAHWASGPFMSSADTRPVKSAWSCGSCWTRVTWLMIPHIHTHPINSHPPQLLLYRWHLLPNLKALLEATQGGQVITVVPFKESSLQCFCVSHWIIHSSRLSSHARCAFLPLLYIPTGGQKPR